MLGHRSASANLVSCLAVLSFVFLTTAQAGAQTPIVHANTLTPGASALELAAGSKNVNTSTIAPGNSTEDATKAVAATSKSETEVAKGSADPPTEPSLSAVPAAAAQCPATTPQGVKVRQIKADVVAIPKAIMLNRLGATIPDGFVFALKRDTVNGAGKQLRADKRPRPIVLRANVGDCLRITFTNAIPPANFTAATVPAASIGTQEVSLHIQGMEWASGHMDDGSFVGQNNSSLASPAPPPTTPLPPQTQIYTLYVRNEGTFLLYTMGDTSSDGNQLSRGLFGALNVQPTGAEWYRSQVTQQDLVLARKKGPNNVTTGGHPVIDYKAVYPAGSKYPDGSPIPPKTPILSMIDADGNIVHTDLTAIITGPNAGRFPGSTGVNNPEPNCNAENNGTAGNPLFCANPASPDRKQPYREVTIIYHEVGQIATQAFPIFRDPAMESTVNAGFDGFAINYGTGGIGAEIYANRVGIGPMGACVDCKFEEFFLSAWSVGDPAMLVDRPANTTLPSPVPPGTPAQPPIPPPPPLCTAADYGDTNPPVAPNPNCANARQPVAGAVDGSPYSLARLDKATRAYYPDDPSNVYHSYINDHLKFRIHHGGTVATHVHHQHAHQWLQSPNSDQGSYLDSQMISPGASYTLEMTYNGSGNRNKVVGDSIFHCHFYPHFAAGMWAMWRTHDVFEAGSELANGIPVRGTRALPDAEIKMGTPNPALVPMPTIPMAPMPSPVFIDNGQIVFGTTMAPDPTGASVTANPGFPFFIPGIAGSRAPHPPLDFACTQKDASGKCITTSILDGGLPRHVVKGGTISYERHTQFDWSKDMATMDAIKLPEDGTHVEKIAMGYFGKRCYDSFFPDGTANNCGPTPSFAPQMTQGPPKGFVLNGLPRGPQQGAPFADPAVDDDGKAVNVDPATNKQRLRQYQAAAIQVNQVLNKQKWHFPQQRMLTLWKDVEDTINFSEGKPGRKAEPLFFRGNSGDIIEYWHTNLVPNYYLVDDFQVRTPTDILGQHIHLVKFDVTSSDGAGNGFNYEDGTFSPQEVQETINAINHSPSKGFVNDPNKPLKPTPVPSDILSCPPGSSDPRCKPCPENWTTTSRPQCESWMGAQTTIQRWYLDPLVDDQGVDRTLRTVFTHDHFGPSTHQQAGLYAGLVVEPMDSTWKNSETGAVMGRPDNLPPIRSDGGPTSWKADIVTKDKTGQDVSYREFVLEFQDLQLAYTNSASGAVPIKNANPDPSKGWRDGLFAVSPAKFNVPPSNVKNPMPRLISTGNIPATGTQSVNYYNEPIGFRIKGFSDLSYAYDNQEALKNNPDFPSVQDPNPDPLTPLMRAYQNDRVQVRVLVGAHVFAHQFNFEGPTWFSEPSWKNSGYRSAQAMGLSEHFEFLFNVPSSSAPNTNRKCPDDMSTANCVDYLYSPSLDETGIPHGLWGLFRSYDPTVEAKKLKPLPNNPIGPGTNVTYSTCPANAPQRTFKITAVTSEKALANQTKGPGELVFNNRGAASNFISTKLGVIYVFTDDLKPDGTLKDNVPVEPLILRANAGDCINVKLTNGIPANALVLNHNFTWPAPFNLTAVNPHMSKFVGLHPQLLSYDAATSFGLNVGWNSKNNADQFANLAQPNANPPKAAETISYQWYAGKIERDPANNGNLKHTAVEFGSLNLFPSDPLFQHVNGLFGSMIIEPQGSTWKCGEDTALRDCYPTTGSTVAPPSSRASATVTMASGKKFREFAVMISDALLTSDGSNKSAINYSTEPKAFRYPNPTPIDFSCMTSNKLIEAGTTTPIGNPKTPVFTAAPGDQVRFRMTHPFGTGDSQVFTVHGHVWQRNPYSNSSRDIGNNNLSQWLGSRDNHGSTDHFDLVIDQAGGTFKKPGDYLYTAFLPDQASLGAWGIFRVGGNIGANTPNGACKQVLPTAAPAKAPVPKLMDRFHRLPNNDPQKPDNPPIAP